MIRDFKSVKQWLPESNAEMLQFNVGTFLDSQEVLRGFPTSKIPEGKLELCKELLITRGSVINNKDSHTIKDPQIDKETWYGTWQHFYSGFQVFNRKEYLTQTIRLGFYQNIAFQNSEISGERTVQTRQQLGLTTESAESVAGVTGQVKSQRIDVDRRDGSRRVLTDKDIGTEQVTTTKIISPARETTITEKTVQASPLSDPTSAKGYIKRIINAASRYFGRYTTIEESNKPTDQESTSYDVSKAGETTKVKHTENDTSLEKPEATKGTINRQESHRTEAGNEATTEESEIPADQESTDGSDSGFMSSVVTRHTENDTDPEVTDSEKETRTNLNVRRTESGKLETEEIVDTSKHVSVDEYVSRYAERVTEYLSEEYHDENPPDIDDDTADGEETLVQSHFLDDFLTHNFKVLRSVKKFSFDDEVSWDEYSGVQYVTSQAYSETLGRYWNDKTYIYERKAAHTLKFFDNAEDAAAYIDADFVSVGTQVHNNGSTVSHTGEFEWLAHKISHTKTQRTGATIEYTEPTS